MSRYREHPEKAPEPTLSTLPNSVDFVDTVARPVGALVMGVVQERELAWALTGELNCGATAIRPKVSKAAVAGPATTLRDRRDNFIMTSKTFPTR